MFLIIGSLVDDFTCCSSKPLIVAWLGDFDLPSHASMLVIGVFTLGSIWQTGFATFLILFQQVDTVPPLHFHPDGKSLTAHKC